MTNTFIVEGNLTKDPQLKETQSGKIVCELEIANNVGFGENRTASFYRVSVWGKQGEYVAKTVSKGSKVVVVGELTIRTFTKNDGTKGFSAEIFARDVSCMSETKVAQVQEELANLDDKIPF